jgi:pimeloyl-ACP methyl ester carboxylesterase
MVARAAKSDDDFQIGSTRQRIAARDGTALSATIHQAFNAQTGAPAKTGQLPFICVNSMDRTQREFENFASTALSLVPNRKIICFDARGRGGADHPKNAELYSFDRDADDLIDLLTALGVEHGHFIGAGYGGLVAMSLASARPGAMKSLCLLDSAPAIDGEGIARMQYRFQRLSGLASKSEAAAAFADLEAKRFPAWQTENFEHAVEVSMRETSSGRKQKTSWQPDLGTTYLDLLQNLDLSEPLGDRWDLWKGLRATDLQIFLPNNSGLVSGSTQSRMEETRQNTSARTEIVELPGVGSTPLIGPELSQRILDFASAP